MERAWFVLGAVLGAVAVVAGAFGAHGLRARLEPASLALWETAARYLMYAALALMVAGLAAARRPGAMWSVAALALAGGGLLFSSSVAGLALGGPRWLGAVAPVGGALLIAGFLALAAAGWRG